VAIAAEPEPEPTPEPEPEPDADPWTAPEVATVPVAADESAAVDPWATPADPVPPAGAADPWAGITWSAADQPAPWSASEPVPADAADDAALTEAVASEATATPDAAAPEPVPPAVPEPLAAAQETDQLNLDDDQRRWLGRNVELVEGIGSAYGRQLESLGIVTLQDLLLRGATRRGRQEIADRTGISGKLILRWVNNADLFRIRGVGTQYADLLEAAGVDTVVELALRRPENLVARLQTTNEIRSLVRQVPSEAQVADWIAQAKGLPRIVAY
jgi:predicted flap endonuclease-1-like 5' DNA nuclease